MEFEPPIDRARMLEAVRIAFPIDADGIRFLPVGYAAACYELTIGSNPAAFLKVWPNTSTGRESSERLPIVLPLLRMLGTRPLRALVPTPLLTRTGESTTFFDDMPCVVFAFIRGSYPTGWPDVSEELWVEMARTLAEIHGMDELGEARPGEDPLDAPFETDLNTAVEQIDRTALQDRVFPLADEARDQLLRLRDLRARIKRWPTVLCHTDFGGHNLLVSDGRLAVLDWDEARIGPPELDLRIGVEPSRRNALSQFLAAYVEAGGVRDLSVDRFAFALLRRALEDFTARVVRLTEIPDSAPELIEQMKRWGQREWRDLDRRMEVVVDAVAQAQGH